MFPSFISWGFGGSRRGCPVASSVLPLLARQVWQQQSYPVFVSCAPGVSALARQLFPSARVFSLSQPGLGAAGRAVYAARGAAFVRALAASSHPCFVVFPGCPCPAPVRPSSSPARCWCGGGSGSWAEAAFAAGLGVPVLAFLPQGVQPPAAWGAWQPVTFGGSLLQPAPAQALF